MVDVKKMSFKHSKPGTRSKGFEITTIDKILRKDKFMVLTKPAQVDFYNMIFITKGKGSFEVDFKEYPVSRGDIIFISEEREHRFIGYEELEGVILIFTEDFLYEVLGTQTVEVLDLFKDTYLNPIMDVSVDGNDILERQAMLLKDIYDVKNTDFDFQVFSLAFRTMITMVRKRTLATSIYRNKNSKVFLEFSSLIDRNLKRMKTVKEYATLMKTSNKTINIATHKAVNMSAKQYIIYKLIQKIKVNLCFEDKNIEEIAHEFEFSEAYNLTKFFKKYTGLTPTAFKKINT